MTDPNVESQRLKEGKMAISRAVAWLGLLVGLMATGSRAFGKEPSLAEIAAAQAASWQAIRAFDMKYELRVKWVDEGKNIVEYAAPCR
jgi:hypothetical protein